MDSIQKIGTTHNVNLNFEFFSKNFNIPKVLTKCNAVKEQGYLAVTVLLALMGAIFLRMPLSKILSKSEEVFNFGKDVAYRFLNNEKINWENLILLVALSVIQYLRGVTNERRKAAIVIDDTTYYRNRSKHVEMLSKCYDHVKHKCYNGFSFLTAGWTDGASFFPIAGKLQSASSEKELVAAEKKTDLRTIAGKRRMDAKKTKPELVLQLLTRLKKHEKIADHVLFDSWFSSPKLIMGIRSLDYHVVCRMKNTVKQKFLFNGESKTLADIYKISKKRCGRSKYLLSSTIQITHPDYKENVDAKVVYVRNRNKTTQWIALLSTDLSLTEDEIITTYAKRWSIEVYFKMCKSYLGLQSDYYGRSYDCITAHSTIVMLRYIFLAYEQRLAEDPKTMGVLFSKLCDKTAEIGLESAIRKLLEELIVSVQNIVQLSKQQLICVVNDFYARIPLRYREMLSFSRCET